MGAASPNATATGAWCTDARRDTRSPLNQRRSREEVAAAGGSGSGEKETAGTDGRRTPSAEQPECSRWPNRGEAGARSVTNPDRLRQLAASWLAPSAATGVTEADLMPRLGTRRAPHVLTTTSANSMVLFSTRTPAY